MRAFLLASVLGLALAGQARAEVFGLSMGEPLAGHKVVETNRSGVSLLQSVPKPHPLFTSYWVDATKGQGLCRINAYSNVYEMDGYGDRAREAYDRLVKALTAKYGAGVAEEEVRAGGEVMKQPQFFTMGLQTGDRVHKTTWMREVDSTLPAELRAVVLRIEADDFNTPFLRVTYEFSNFLACHAEQEASTAEVL